MKFDRYSDRIQDGKPAMEEARTVLGSIMSHQA